MSGPQSGSSSTVDNGPWRRLGRLEEHPDYPRPTYLEISASAGDSTCFRVVTDHGTIAHISLPVMIEALAVRGYFVT